MIGKRSPAQLGLLAAVAALALDQATKGLALASLEVGRRIPVAQVFNLQLGFNEGVSFGLLADWFAGRPSAPIILALAIIAALAFWLSRTGDLRESLGLGAVIGGALGNVADRMRLGAVVDFLDFHFAGYHWPAFNLADVAIVVGVALLLVTGIGRGPKTIKHDRSEAERSNGGLP